MEEWVNDFTKRHLLAISLLRSHCTRVLLLLIRQVTVCIMAQQLLDQMPGLGDAAKQAYVGRDMTSIRTVNVKTGMVIELKSYTAGVPDAALLDLPPNLQPLPGGLGIKPPGGGGSLLERR